jgi:UDP-GlcNAc:undecaprenyl-phosphate GlcNAc-1-phosphate transferase
MPRGALLFPTILSLIVSAATAFMLTPLARDFARARGWVDRPDGRRKLHVTPVPRLGGVAVFAAFGLTCALLLALERAGVFASELSAAAYLHLLVACAAVAGVGIVDDVYDVRPVAKLFVQSAAALYLFGNGYRIDAVSNPFNGESVELGLLAAPLTVVWFVGMSNAFNLVDGLDGLAAGLGLFSTTTLFMACLINERWEIAIIASALGGSLLGFLRYNFNPASVFLGDSGALFVGFALAAIAVRGSMKSSAVIAVAAPLMALAVPILDASIAVFRRLVRGDGVFKADGDHIHHRLIGMGLTPRRVVVILYAVAAVFGALSLLTMTSRSQVVGLVVIASSVVTWIGVQQLGYAEFSEIQRALRHGLGNERRMVGNHVYLSSLAAQFRVAPDRPALWAKLVEVAARLQFHRVELWGGPIAIPDPSLRELLSEWTDTARSSPADASAIWTIPAAHHGEVFATLRFVRSLSEPAQFEPGYLLNALQEGFSPRLHALLQPATMTSSSPALEVSPPSA